MSINHYYYFLIYLARPGLWLWHVGWLSSVAACGIFGCSIWNLVPCPGVEPRPPALGAWSLSHWTTREVLDINS